MFRFRSLLIALIALSCTLSFAAQRFSPKQIVFTGYQNASQAELLATSGLQPGVALSSAAIQAAAQKLNNTGMFSEVRFSYNEQTLSFLLKPCNLSLPAQFDNFVWWNNIALQEAIHQKVPLFHGQVAPSSGMEQEIVTVLTSLLRTRGITATVEAFPIGEIGQPPTAIQFSIVSPNVVISNFSIEGVSPAFISLVNAAIKPSLDSPYAENDTPKALAALALMPYQKSGYLDAHLSHIQHGLPVVQNGTVYVSMTADIIEGQQYRIGQLNYASIPYLTKADYLKASPLKPGDVPSSEKLSALVKSLQLLYANMGYAMAEVNMQHTQHDVQHLVDYTLSVSPGPVFHMGNLVLENLDARQESNFLNAWKMQRGDIYKQIYITDFLKRNPAIRSLTRYSATYKTIAKSATQSVDVIITFHKN